jgi:hypothetical protein
MRSNRHAFAVVAAILVAAVVGCSPHHNKKVSPWAAFPGVGNPEPRLNAAGTEVTDAGGTVNAAGVRISVPQGALTVGHKATVRTGSPPSPAGVQRYGSPVGIDHDAPISQPITVTWTLPADVTEHERETAVLVHWDPSAKAWLPIGLPAQVSGTTISAKLSEFSIIDWVSDAAANAGQSVLQLVGARADAPSCKAGGLPSWVRQVVDPDENLSAAAIRFCVEPDKADVVTGRVVNNRSFAQQVTLTPDDQKWAWTWTGPLDASVSGLVYRLAQSIFDNDNRMIVPPLQQIAVGIDRPSGGGQIVQTGTATVTAVTVLIDIAAYVVDQMNKTIGKNPFLTAYLQDALKCGGDAILSLHASHDVGSLVKDIAHVIGGCAEQLLDPKSKFGAAFETEARKIIAAGGASAQAIADANRMLYQLSAAYRALQFAEIAFYASDQLANAMVGPLSFSIRGDGKPQVLGQWKPGCASIAADSNALYKNLALQDMFSDKSKELYQFPQWQPSARIAVAPLSACGLDFLQQLAAYLPGHWGDPKAAAIVATEIRRLTPFPTPPTSTSLLATKACVKPCTITGHVFITHPAWGPIDLVTIGGGVSAPGIVQILAVDPAGQVRWSYRNEYWYVLAPNSPATDKTGHVFFTYNPGRYDGVIVLVPTTAGFNDLHTLPAYGDYNERFYSAYTADPKHSGSLQIVVAANDCVPSCAGGTVWATAYEWNGKDYAAPPSPCPTAAELIHGFTSEVGPLKNVRVVGNITCAGGWLYAQMAFSFSDGTPSDGAMLVAHFEHDIWTITISGTEPLFWDQDAICAQMPAEISALACVHT